MNNIILPNLTLKPKHFINFENNDICFSPSLFNHSKEEIESISDIEI